MKDHTHEDRAQVGIGTLIVFIAMVLVAAIASGVLIHTAGFLQTKSEVTGEESVDRTTNRIQVLSSIGQLKTAYDIADNNIVVTNEGDVVTGEVVNSDEVQANVVTNDGRNVVVGTSDNAEATDGENVLSAGGENVEESSTQNGNIIADGSSLEYSVELGSGDNIITYGDGGGTQYNVETSGGTNVIADTDATFDNNDAITKGKIGEINLLTAKAPGSGDIQLGGVTVQYIGPNGKTTLVKEGTAGAGSSDTFTITEIKSESSDDVIVETADRYRIDITLSDGSNGELRPLKEGETAKLLVTTSSGATTSVLVAVPDSLESDESAVSL